MLTIRLSRVGRKNHAQYKVVVTEQTAPVKGRFVEQLGSYDPHLKNLVLKEARVKYWLEKGVQCSDTVFNLFAGKGIIESEKIKLKLPAKPQAQISTEETKQAPVVQENKEAVIIEEPKKEEAVSDSASKEV